MIKYELNTLMETAVAKMRDFKYLTMKMDIQLITGAVLKNVLSKGANILNR
jgi:hypothetical protein